MLKHHRLLTNIAISLLIGPALLLGGCGGGGDTGIAGDSQSPDPVVVDTPIAYIKRSSPSPDNNGNVSYTDLDDPIAMTPGARLYIRPRASNRAEEIDLTDRIKAVVASELGVSANRISLDIKGLDTAFDGSTLIFSARAIPDLATNNQPELYTWNLWTYDFSSDTLDYLISASLIRNEGADTGGGHDMYPHFLTDDRIVFSSSRQTAIQETQLNEGRGQRYSPVATDNPASQAISLHIYEPDSGAITQISTHQTADIEPSTLESGEIVFSRRGQGLAYSLFQINPSGARDTALYGASSSAIISSEESANGAAGPIHFLQPRQLPDGRIMALIKPGPRATLGGDVAIINSRGFIDVFTPSGNYNGGARGQMPLTNLEINALDDLSPGGKFLSAYPLHDGTNRVLVSWSPCRIINRDSLIKPCNIADSGDTINGRLTPAPPHFGLWMYDPAKQTQLPVVLAEQDFIISEAVAAESRIYPRNPVESGVFDPSLAAENKGLLIIDSVYNEDNGTVTYAPLGISTYADPANSAAYTQRPARFMRLLRPVPVPNNNVIPNLPNSGGVFGLLEILGYVPVEPDGSVTVKVPANTPLMLNVMRSDGRRIARRHTTAISVAPGEVRRCVGCHDPASNVAHGRYDSQPSSQNPGAVALPGLIGFPNTDPALFASALGQTMAEVYDLRKPDIDNTQRERDIRLHVTYTDEWTDATSFTPDANIDLTYDPAWNLPMAYPLIVPNLDPSLQGRIVIHYGDHIQPIWDRTRTITLNGNPVMAPDGSPATSCVSCHTTNGTTMVPAGQLDLTGGIANDPLTISYLELTRGDLEQWDLSTGGIGDRTRLCDVLDPLGNPITQVVTFPVPAPVIRGSALLSQAFFDCFESGDPTLCGRFTQDLSAPPANCTDSGGTVSSSGPITTKPIPNTFAEAEMLMAAKMTPSSLTNPNELMDVLRTNCQSCHRVGGSASSYPHSDSNDDTAYNSLKSYINLVNPAGSTLVFRLETLNHQCWSADCNSDAAVMTAAITSFADAVPTQTVTPTIPSGSPSTGTTFDHTGLLSPSELRLISEWLDTGGAFYNNPFDPRL